MFAGGRLSLFYIPLIAYDLLETVKHAIVRIGTTSLASLKLPVMSVSAASLSGHQRKEAYTLVLTTSSGYLEPNNQHPSPVSSVHRHSYWHIHNQNL